MLSLIYASTATKLFAKEELVTLLETSQKNNVKKDITGMLLYRGGNFIQVIEGEADTVLELFETIKKDPRHKDVTLLSQDPIKSRQFPSWSMGFRNIDQMTVAELEGFTDFLSDDFSPEFFKEKPARAYILLLNFKDIMR